MRAAAYLTAPWRARGRIAHLDDAFNRSRIEAANLQNEVSLVETNLNALSQTVGTQQLALANAADSLERQDTILAEVTVALDRHQASLRSLEDRLTHVERCLGLGDEKTEPDAAREAALDQRVAEAEMRLLAYLEGPFLDRVTVAKTPDPTA